jgi:membrane-associated phospholipid phosphatase
MLVRQHGGVPAPPSSPVAAIIAMSLAVVVTANHFVVDVLGGLAICAAALVVATRLEQHQHERQDGERRRTATASTSPTTDRGRR